MKLIISKIETFATLDGQGIRTSYFLQGCLLRCIYCHNPETWKICKLGDKKKAGAHVYAISKIVEKCVKNKPYFANGGGVTFSGGEPLVQARALAKLCRILKKNKINVVIDTSGVFGLALKNRYVQQVLKYTDEVLFDLKFTNDEDYLKYAGGKFSEAIEFLNYLEKIKMPTTVKTVIVPNINDDEESVKKYVDIIKNYKCIKNFELLCFHTMGFNKYKELNIINRLEKTTALDAKKLLKLQKFADSLVHNERTKE